MSIVLEPVKTLRHSSLPNRNVCEERMGFDFCERPITPPITPSSTRLSARGLRLAPSPVIAEPLSGRLEAPTNCPSTQQHDIDERGSVAPISTQLEPPPNINLPSSAYEGGVIALPSSENHSLRLKSNIKESITKSEFRYSSQSEGGTSQDLADNADVQLANPTAATLNVVSAAGSETSSVTVVCVSDQGAPDSSSTQPISNVVLTLDVASPKIYQRDKKLYVGKMRDIQCPSCVETEWTAEIRPRLIKDLLPVLQSLPRSMASEETIIEPELCMAGYATGKATNVRLIPTVWIRCGGKRCRKAIQKAVNDLVYLHSFSQGTVEVRIRGPRPAASSSDLVPIKNSPGAERKYLVNSSMRLQVQLSTPGASACGLRLKVLNSDAYEHEENILTIGGLIKFNNKIYGLTAAHGILDASRVAKGTSSPTSHSSESAASESELESKDDADTSFDKSCMDEHSPPIKLQSREYDDLGQTAKVKFRKQTQQLQWGDVTFCGPMSYLGQGSVTGGTNDRISAPQDADFALIDMGFSATYQLYNEYKPDSILGLSNISICGVKHDGDLNAGEVFLLTGQNQTTAGHLLQGSALFINKAIVFNTRKIQLDSPLSTGTSGTWVVQDNLLCGIIIAVYDDDPYAHMITADKMFQDIRDFVPSPFHSQEVVIATEDDIKAVYATKVTSCVTSLASAHSSDSITEFRAAREGQSQNEGDFELPLLEDHVNPAASQNVVSATPIPFSYVPHQTYSTNFDTTFREINNRKHWHEDKPQTSIVGLINAQAQTWDAYTALNILPRGRYTTICMGTTLKRTRCRWNIPQEDVTSIRNILDEMERISPINAIPQLHQLARLSLCYEFHRGTEWQAINVSNQWEATIRALIQNTQQNEWEKRIDQLQKQLATAERERDEANAKVAINIFAPEATTVKLPRKIKPQHVGLKVLFQPNETEDIELDVVAVHGIGAHPEHTWTHKEKMVSWLSEPTMLPAALPKARIMAFGYESYWFGDDAVRQSVSGIASKMLQELCHERAECGFRPIIFVGHCIGGLVIQQAYRISTSNKEDYPKISDSVTGAVFLGTPHNGVSGSSGLQTQGKIYQTIVQANVQMQDNILHSIAQDNDVLVDIIHEFTRLVSRQQKLAPILFCFYETKTTKVGAISGIPDMPPEFVVGESSGTLSGHMNESLPLDHFAINKFEDAEDDNYKLVCRQIVKMSKASTAIIEGRLGEVAPVIVLKTSRNLLAWRARGIGGQSGNIIKHNSFS